MITQPLVIVERLVGEDFLPFLCWSAACWILGVGWAAYRALDWADRIRTWADREASQAVDAFPPAGEADL